MLSPDSETLIREEETVRFTVRKQLEDGQRRGIWKTLNEPFSLWVLSTLIVGALTFSYTRIQSYVKEQKDRQNIIERLDRQVGFRLHFALKLRKQPSNFGQTPAELENAISARAVLNTLLHDSETTRIYPDFKDRSTASLLWEEFDLTKTPKNTYPRGARAGDLVETLLEKEQQIDDTDFTSKSEKDQKDLLVVTNQVLNLLDEGMRDPTP
jgi:hypothetical protein